MNKKFEEIKFDKMEIEKINFIKFEDSILFINYNNRLIGIDLDGNLIYNIELNNEEIFDIEFEENNSFYAMSDNKICFYSIPSYNQTELEFTAKIYDGTLTNNIEIFIKSNTGDQLVTLIDPETLEEIQPNYHIIYSNNSFIKIMGRKIKELIMRIKITPNTEIESIVVNSDRVFLK
jgi:hypothetical protein